MPLTQGQIEQYHTDGYLVVENLISQDDVQKAFASISRIIAGDLVALNIEKAYTDGKREAPADKELRVRKLMHFVGVDEHLKYLSEHPTLVEYCEHLVDDKVRMAQDMALLKPPHVGVEKPWHQDDAYFLVDPPEKVVGVWIALDEATTENGCMQVIPGSHRLGPKPHYHIRDCQLPDERVDVAHAVQIPLKPGGALFFSGLMHHGTPDNHSPKRRRALQYHYMGLSCTKLTPEQHGKMFNEAGVYAGCAVWPPEARFDIKIAT